MRVLAVAQRLDERAVDGQTLGKARRAPPRRPRLAQVGRDRRVVLGGAPEGLGGEPEARGVGQGPVARAAAPRAPGAYWPGSVTTADAARGSWPRPGSCWARRCRCSRSPPRASRPAAPPSARTDRASPPRDRSAGCRAARARPGARARRAGPGCRRARCGCSVFTRPSSISGKPVTSATSTTGTPDSRSSFAVPPVERISTPRAARPAGELHHAGLVVHAQERAPHSSSWGLPDPHAAAVDARAAPRAKSRTASG